MASMPGTLFPMFLNFLKFRSLEALKVPSLPLPISTKLQSEQEAGVRRLRKIMEIELQTYA